eukprot:scaffold831_cov268-Pinguiococcus_pyrenoidosus.AAC.8
MAENERRDANVQVMEEEPRSTKGRKGEKKGRGRSGSSAAPGSTTDIDVDRDLEERIEKLTQAMDSIQDMQDPPSDSDAAFWKAKFQELSALRMTEPEKEAERIREDVQNQLASMQAMIQGFQQEEAREVTSLESSRALALKQMKTPLAPAAEGSAAEQVKHLKKLLMAYQSLTGMVLQLQEAEAGTPAGEPSEDSFLCTALNRDAKRATQFCVTLPSASEHTATFEPIANIKELPEDLQTDFDMSTAQLPILIAKVNCFLFRDAT